LKKKLQSVAIFKKTPIFVMRSAVLLTATRLINLFTTGCCMKKIRIEIQSLLHNVVCLTAIQKFLSVADCSNTLIHSKDLLRGKIDYTSDSIINKNKTQSFQLPK
jgi:hypothetical protein